MARNFMAIDLKAIITEIDETKDVINRDLAWVMGFIKAENLSKNEIRTLMSDAAVTIPVGRIVTLVEKLREEGYAFPMLPKNLGVWGEAYLYVESGKFEVRNAVDLVAASSDVKCHSSGGKRDIPQDLVTLNPEYKVGAQYVAVSSDILGVEMLTEVMEGVEMTYTELEADTVKTHKKPVHCVVSTIPKNTIPDTVTSLDVKVGDELYKVQRGCSPIKVMRSYDTYFAGQIAALYEYNGSRWVTRNADTYKCSALKHLSSFNMVLNQCRLVVDETLGKWATIDALLAWFRGISKEDYDMLVMTFVRMCYDLDKCTVDDHKYKKAVGCPVSVKKQKMKEKSNVADKSLEAYYFARSQAQSTIITPLAESVGFIPGMSVKTIAHHTMLWVSLVIQKQGGRVKISDTYHALFDAFNQHLPKEAIQYTDDQEAVFVSFRNAMTGLGDHSKKDIDRLYAKEGSVIVGNIPPHWIRPGTVISLPGELRHNPMFIYDLHGKWNFPLLCMANVPVRSYDRLRMFDVYSKSKIMGIKRSLFPTSSIGLFSVIVTTRKKTKALPEYELATDLAEAVQLEKEQYEGLKVTKVQPVIVPMTYPLLSPVSTRYEGGTVTTTETSSTAHFPEKKNTEVLNPFAAKSKKFEPKPTGYGGVGSIGRENDEENPEDSQDEA